MVKTKKSDKTVLKNRRKTHTIETKTKQYIKKLPKSGSERQII